MHETAHHQGVQEESEIRFGSAFVETRPSPEIDERERFPWGREQLLQNDYCVGLKLDCIVCGRAGSFEVGWRGERAQTELSGEVRMPRQQAAQVLVAPGNYVQRVGFRYPAFKSGAMRRILEGKCGGENIPVELEVPLRAALWAACRSSRNLP
jgi:hypothetical protein